MKDWKLYALAAGGLVAVVLLNVFVGLPTYKGILGITDLERRVAALEAQP